jgi:ABC-type transport system involved in multi-copper enzyme maturation permease subunit
MRDRPRFLVFRRLLFPYTGEEPLTHAQGKRVIVTWALVFSLALSVATLPAILIIKAVSIQKLALILLVTFLTGAIIFGAMACFVVMMVNRSARFMQRRSQEAKSERIEH